MLAKFGFKACGVCHLRALEMDRRGPDWCEANLATIAGWLREAAAQRKLPFIEVLARSLIRAAIRRARSKSRTP